MEFTVRILGDPFRFEILFVVSPLIEKLTAAMLARLVGAVEVVPSDMI